MAKWYLVNEGSGHNMWPVVGSGCGINLFGMSERNEVMK
jgi:hypothetical protein